MSGCVLSIFGVVPKRVGGVEMFAREVSLQLAGAGWQSVFCFIGEPAKAVRKFLDVRGATVEAGPDFSRANWAVMRHVRGLLKRYRPDIVHLYFVDPVSLYPWVVRFCSGRRIFVTDQISRPEGYVPVSAPLWKRVTRQAITWPVNRLIAVSDFNLQCGEALGLVRSGRLARIHNAVDLSRPLGDGNAFRRKLSIPEDRRIVLQVSWMRPEKGIADLLDAAKLVLAADAAVQFVMTGEGEQLREYMDYASQLGIADHVTWTGLLDDPLVEGVYSAADVVCQLSRWQEAFGWVIAEAMVCRKPVVATAVGGIPEIVRDGVSGFLVPPRNPAMAAEKILRLLADDSLRGKMGDAGRAIVEELFDLKRNVAELVELYGIRH
jgi:glycosyltransferase involved in cell wall biosynthesis